jgi:hypothetical protein
VCAIGEDQSFVERIKAAHRIEHITNIVMEISANMEIIPKPSADRPE